MSQLLVLPITHLQFSLFFTNIFFCIVLLLIMLMTHKDYNVYNNNESTDSRKKKKKIKEKWNWAKSQDWLIDFLTAKHFLHHECVEVFYKTKLQWTLHFSFFLTDILVLLNITKLSSYALQTNKWFTPTKWKMSSCFVKSL